MRLSVPSSIVLASIFIALGLYFGLRERAPNTGAPPPPVGTVVSPQGNPTSPAGAGSASRDVVVPPPPPVPTEDQLRPMVAALVEGSKPRWKAACWDTADPATRKPGRYISVLAFDASGNVDVSGVSEIRDESDPGVGQCLRQQVNDFTITAPQRHVVFETPFEIP